MKYEKISHYKILEKLGEGGMGQVYKAFDTKLERNVAIKLMLPHVQTGESSKERFIQEAKSASALDHPNICTIYEIGETDDGSLFIAMAYYEGESLQEYLKREIPSYNEALDIAIQVAKGLECAHQSDIIHRDIKPANIMITDSGIVKIVDFGLAKLAGVAHLTQTGSTLGTAAYMSPEQVKGGSVDHKSDVFSCGVVLYEMFTGIQPFKNDYYHGMMYAVVNEDPSPVTEHKPDLPVELEWILRKSMEKDPDDRFQDMSEMVQFLESLKVGSIDSSQLNGDGTGSKSKNSTLLKSRLIIMASAVIVSVILAVGFYSWYSTRIITEETSPFTTASLPASKQIAVLPFLNIGGQPENAAFVDGLVETLTSILSQLDQFQDQFLVVPSSETSSRNIRSASEARAAFGVNLVVAGSVQHLDDGVRVTINLIDAVSLRQLNSKIIDDNFTEKTALQDEAVLNLASMLGIDLQPRAQSILTAGGTSVPGAYEFYIRGVGHLQRFDRREEIDAAIEQFNRALKEDSNFARAYAGLGDAYLYLYRRTENVDWIQPAVENVEKALSITDEYSPVYTTYGLLLIERGEYEQALEMLDRALEIDPENFEAYRGKARAYLAQQRTEEAGTTYKKAIEMKPDYWAGYMELGVFYYENARFEEAAEQFRIVTELTPKNASAFRNLGGIYYYLGRQDEAMEAFENSLAIEPNYGAYSNLATMYFFDEEYIKAAETYKEALALNDSDYNVWSYLASAYKQLEPPMEDEYRQALLKAREMAEKQLEVNPRNVGILIDLVNFNVDLEDESSARGLLNQVVAMEPSDPFQQQRMGIMYELLDDRNSALEWIEKAVSNGYPAEEITKNPDEQLGSLLKDERFQEIIKQQN